MDKEFKEESEAEKEGRDGSRSNNEKKNRRKEAVEKESKDEKELKEERGRDMSDSVCEVAIPIPRTVSLCVAIEDEHMTGQIC